jgi:guanosine-3',5'-bis(diphosphate) 3'-pyrophosphohydrolase
MSTLPQNLALAVKDLPDKDVERIKEAYLFAADKHSAQKRLCGEPYLNHLVRTATNLAKNKSDVETICAGLLHDVVEDTPTTLAEVSELFGEEVAQIVDGVTKVSSYKLKDKDKVFRDNTRYIEKVDNYRKILFATAKDPRVIIVKLYDRLDNIETLKPMPPHKQTFYARETIEIFAPIAERLGMGHLKSLLEDKSFPYAYKDEYKKFLSTIGDSYKNAEKFINSIIPKVKTEVETAGIKIESIAGRAKTNYSLYKKLERKGSLSEIHDILALRIIVDSVENCYKTLGIIHSIYEPLPDKIKDYIAKPKSNGYQSIHTTVRDKDGNHFEVQIRTSEIHQAAENGISSHWNYKEDNQSTKQKHISSLEWIKELEKLKDITNKKEFLSELKENFFAHQIFIFTPKDDIIRLPAGATPVDFAYKIHTSLGHRTVGAKINGRIVPLSTALKTGDNVEIITSKILNPKKDWLKFVKTAHAQRKINALTKLTNESAMSDMGLKKVSEFIEKNDLPALNKIEAEKLLRDSKTPYNSLEKAFTAIAEGNLGIVKFIKTIHPNFKSIDRKPTFVLPDSDEETIPALKNIPHEFAKCCKPKASDEVIGYLGKEPIVKIHRINCKRLANVDKRRLIHLS